MHVTEDDAATAESLLHIATAPGWAAMQAAGHLRGTPFLHLCTAPQLAFVLEKFFPGQHGLLLLDIDPTGLDIRWETSEPGMDPFPHLYGPAPLCAVRGTTTLA